MTSFTEEYEEPLKMTFVEQDREWLVSILERELEVEDNEEKVTHDMYMGMHLFRNPTRIDTSPTFTVFQTNQFGTSNKLQHNGI